MNATVRKLTDITDTTEVTKLAPPAPGQRLQIADTPFPGDHAAWLVGCHGGAGTSTLAASLAHLGDAGQIIPAANTPAMIVLCAASNREGLEAAHRAVIQCQSELTAPATLLGLVLVDINGPSKLPRSLSRKLTAREAVVANAINGQIWRVPHIPAWTAMLHDDLPEWDPMPDDDTETLSDKQIAKTSATEHVPLSVVDTGRDILDQARTIYTQITKH